MVKPTDGQSDWGVALNAHLDTLATTASLPATIATEVTNSSYLPAAYATTLDAQRVRIAANDASVSLADSQVRYAAAPGWNEQWPNTTSWQVGAQTFPVSGGAVGGTTGLAILTRPITASAARKRYRTRLLTIAGGAERIVMFGWTNATVGGKGTANEMLGIGVHFNYSGTAGLHKIIRWDRGGEAVLGDYTPGAGFYITAWTDEVRVGLDLTDSTGEVAFTYSIPVVGYTPTQVAVYNSDARGLTGDLFTAVTGRDEFVTATDRTHENVAPSGIQTYDSLAGTGIRVELPKNYDSRTPAPVFIYCHGFGGTSQSIIANGATSNVYQVASHLLANGWIVASSDAYSGSEVGAKFFAYVDLYRYVRDRFAIGPVAVGAESFGGVAAARLLAGRTVAANGTKEIPDIAAFVGWYPVLNLSAMYATATWVSDAVNLQYGSLAAAVAAGADPALLPISAFRGVPMKIWHSGSDPVVSKAWSDTLVARVAPYTTEAAVVSTSGGHGDASNFDPPAVLAFLNRAVGR